MWLWGSPAKTGLNLQLYADYAYPANTFTPILMITTIVVNYCRFNLFY